MVSVFSHHHIESSDRRTLGPSDRRTEISGVLVIDKPSGWTSHDVVQRVKRLIRARKVGHLGTLDPAATGVLPLAIDGATKRARELSGSEKVYEFTLVLGAATDTDDDDGEVTATAPVSAGAKALLDAVIPRFIGEVLQRPPDYSAVKVQGRRAYALARGGRRPALEPRPVRIDALSIVGEADGRFRMRLECRSGTYVRSLCRDLGEAIGTRGHASAIRRLRSGSYGLEEAMTVEELERNTEGWRNFLITVSVGKRPVTR